MVDQKSRRIHRIATTILFLIGIGLMLIGFIQINFISYYLYDVHPHVANKTVANLLARQIATQVSYFFPTTESNLHHMSEDSVSYGITPITGTLENGEIAFTEKTVTTISSTILERIAKDLSGKSPVSTINGTDYFVRVSRIKVSDHLYSIQGFRVTLPDFYLAVPKMISKILAEDHIFTPYLTDNSFIKSDVVAQLYLEVYHNDQVLYSYGQTPPKSSVVYSEYPFPFIDNLMITVTVPVSMESLSAKTSKRIMMYFGLGLLLVCVSLIILW
jgi:hypothetical protein